MCGALTGVTVPRSNEPTAPAWRGNTLIYIVTTILILLFNWFLT
ncbi:hypothetical protein [Bradyrhizobium sp. P5_C11_2]